MPSRKNPIDQVKGAAIEALKNPKGAAEKAVGTARETAAIGRMVAGQVGRSAVARAGELAGDVLSRASGRRGASSSTPAPSSAPVPDPDAPAAASAARTGIADKAATVPSTRVPVEDSTGPAPDEKAPAKRGAATKAPAKKAPAKKAAAKKAPAKKAAANKATTKKSTSDVPTPAEVAENIAPAKKSAKKAPAKKTAKKTTTRSAAKKAATETSIPGDRLPQRRTATKPAGPDASDSSLPRSAADVRDSDDVDVTTPVGTSAAGEGSNPDTAEHDLQQPGTPPLLDPGTVHAVQSEAETLQKAADPDKGPDKSPDKG